MTPLSAARYRSVTQLLQKKFRRETGRTLAEGKRLVGEALAVPDAVVFGLMTHEFAGSGDGRSLGRLFNEQRLPVHIVSQKQIGRLTDTVHPQGVLAVIRIPTHDADRLVSASGPGSVLVALDGISDPGNIGTIVRTCAWFGVNGILLDDRSVEIANPKVLRATMGAIFHVPVAEKVDLPLMIPRMKNLGFRIVVTSAAGEGDDVRISPEGRILIVFGSEAHGASPAVMEAADEKLGIPRYGSGESLNVSVAAGIVLHRVRSRSA